VPINLGRRVLDFSHEAIFRDTQTIRWLDALSSHCYRRWDDLQWGKGSSRYRKQFINITPQVSYAILEPGEVPKIHGVTRFPGQEHVAGNSKIPSIIYYDKRGEMKAAGAEADSSSIQALAEDEGWTKAELYIPLSIPLESTLTLSRPASSFASVPGPCTCP